MNDLVILILAGGDSDRFWPLGDKNSLVFLGQPLAYYHLFQLRKFGFNNIVIVVNRQNESLFRRLKQAFSDLDVKLVLQTDKRGMAGAIVSAKKYILGKSILIRNSSDIYEDILLSKTKSALKSNPAGIISGIEQKEYFPGGYLKVVGDNVVSITEKPNPQKIPSNIVTIAFDYFRNADMLLGAINKIKVTTDDIFERALDSLIRDGLKFRFLPYTGFWGYLKYPWHVLNLSSYYLQKIRGQKVKKAFIDKSAVISGDIFIEDGVRILENTKIVGPTYIGKGTIIGQNCLIRESMIGANCVIGFSTEIARSFIGEASWFHTNYIGDSVISPNVAIGAGTVIANYKLNEGTIRSILKDEKLDTGKVKLGTMIGTGVRIGVNASIMPGVKIGKNSFVGPGVSLDRDLEDDKSCQLVHPKYEIRPNNIVLTDNSRKDTYKNLKLT